MTSQITDQTLTPIKSDEMVNSEVNINSQSNEMATPNPTRKCAPIAEEPQPQEGIKIKHVIFTILTVLLLGFLTGQFIPLHNLSPIIGSSKTIEFSGTFMPETLTALSKMVKETAPKSKERLERIAELMGGSSSIIDHPKTTTEFLGTFSQETSKAVLKMIKETAPQSQERLEKMMELMDRFELVLLYERYCTKEIAMLKTQMMLNNLIDLKTLGETGHFVIEEDSRSRVPEQVLLDFEANMTPSPRKLKEELDSLKEMILSQSEKKSESVVNFNKETVQYTKERFERIMAEIQERLGIQVWTW